MNDIKREERKPEKLQVLISHMAEPLVTRAGFDRQRQFSWHASTNTMALEAGRFPDSPIF